MWNWEKLMGFTFVKQNIKYIHRQYFNFTHLIESLHISINTEVYQVTNSLLQQYNDGPTSITELGKECVNLIDLKNRNEKLLHFGSLYARLKIVTQLSENQNFRSQLRHEMLINNLMIIKIEQNQMVQKLIKSLQEDFKHIKVKNNSPCSQKKIFLATDVQKNDTSIQPFFQTFHCIYVLGDFNDLLEPLKSLKKP
ncbi:10235_t:CDS:2 [Dentiscutata heterogama]|uniref:10235_t:CDS:1 n=1 Tax=Dentiscutata heterogama TaxID=1316150 RepID=A0ACA9P7F8_9GLOM|nr:10235_t:CDS:2 [Dentiscutata heterogama]